MLKIDVKGDVRNKTVAFGDIATGEVFTFVDHYEDIPRSGTIYLKADDGIAITLNGPNIGRQEDSDDFISGAIWVVLNATLTIQK